MKICLVGHFKDNIDEGVRNIAKSFYINLKKTDLEIEKIDISSIKNFIKIKNFKPDIIHFVLTPTISGIIISKLISILNPNSKVIISAIHPSVPKNKLLKIFKVDMILVQSSKSANLFNSLGFNTKYLYNGVDTNKFKPNNEKIKLRKKYGISLDKFIVLHLASLKKERNLCVFKKIQKEKDIQVLIIGRENEDYDQELVDELENAGCLIWIKHFEKIEDIYNLSDCYIFPTINDKACIETPLSVLESMACNLPVITTKFGAIPDLFKESEGMFFINEENKISKNIEEIRNKNIEIRTRDNILTYSWENMTKNLIDIYRDLLE